MKDEKDEDIKCKYCLTEKCEETPEELLDNPFIAPCNCKGSAKFVHLKCL